ncbi:MAG: LamB/YcsF family protein [Deltaproteobacteria bacterium]|nr:LamB/YcsF family protein [Deltaproteobacteria bacterium]
MTGSRNDGDAPTTIDLNADVGEGHDDAPLLPYLSSVNVACGGHAGDAETMRRTCTLARASGLAIGAHPGFADRATLGRRDVAVEPAEVESLVAEQVERLARIAHDLGARIAHVKPHGALYNLAARDAAIAAAVARGVRAVDPSLALVGLAGSYSLREARALGLRAIAEAFVDRAYREDGSLVSREEPGALVIDPEHAAERAVRLVREERVSTAAGAEFAVRAETLCVHGDTPGALAIAKRVHAALRAAGIVVAAPR